MPASPRHRQWFRGPFLAVLLAFALTSVNAVSASAAGDNEGGLWYYNDYAVANAVSSGANGSGVKVAVIDGDIDAEAPQLIGADITIREPSYCADDKNTNTLVPATSTVWRNAHHATDMVSLIVGNGKGPGGQKAQLGVAPKAHILLYATGYSADPGNPDELSCPAAGARGDADGDIANAIAAAVTQSVSDDADIITIATVTDTTPALTAAVAAAVRAGVVVVAGRANEPVPTLDSELAALNGVVTVQAMDPSGQVQAQSAVVDPTTDVVAPGVDIAGLTPDLSTIGLVNGTSPATNIVGGFLADVKSKYPEATGNQLIQTLVRNTGTDAHAFAKDPGGVIGYGAVSLRHMLSVDPTTYPDINPLVTKDAGVQPTYAEIYGKTAAPGGQTPTPTTTSSTTANTARSNAVSLVSSLLIVGGIALVIVAAAVVAILIVVRRSRRVTRDANRNRRP